MTDHNLNLISYINGLEVSTRHLNNRDIFETIICDGKGNELCTIRHASRDDAIKWHDEAQELIPILNSVTSARL